MLVPQMLLRCKGGNDLFEESIAAERIPKRVQLQFTIGNATWKAAGDRKRFVERD